MSKDPEPLEIPEEAKALYEGYLEARSEGAPADLDELCRRHPGQAEALRRLDRAYRRVERMLIAPPNRSEAGPASQGPPHEGIRYRVVREIARGGMGRILEVEDGELHRTLAMKVLRRDASTMDPSSLERRTSRLVNEAQILGQLDHPGIVPVHEVGRTGDGDPFFTMQLVRGGNLGAVFQKVARGEEGWTTTRVVGVLQKVADAVAYAHSKGVIHRDLKPANVMVGAFGETYVMDWGLAKAQGRRDVVGMELRRSGVESPGSTVESSSDEILVSVQTDRRAESDRDPSSPLLTMEGDIVGTPAYMSPEQAEGHVDAIDARSDVYSIGAMLYHLLTGQAPYAELESASPPEVLAAVQAGPPLPVSRLARKAPAALVAVCERAMKRDPEERYSSSREMADDLRAYLEGRVVRAHHTGPFAELSKWVVRNKGAAAAITVVILSLVGFTVFQARANEDLRVARDEARRQAEALRRQVYFNTIALAADALKNEDISHMKSLLEECPEDLRDWEWRYLARTADTSDLVLVGEEHWGLRALAWSHDDSWIAAAGHNRVIVWDLETREQLITFPHPEAIDSISFSPTEPLLATVCRDRTLRVWDVSREQLAIEHTFDAGTEWVELSPDGTSLLVAGTDGQVWTVPTHGREPPEALRAHDAPVVGATWSRDGTRIITASKDQTVAVHDALTGQRALSLEKRHTDWVKSVVASDGWFASGGYDDRIVIWSLETGEVLTELPPHRADIQRLAVSPDGRLLASSGGCFIRLWDTERFLLRDLLVGHDLVVYHLAFSRDGTRLASCSSDGTVRIWNMLRPDRVHLHRASGPSITWLALSPSGQRIAFAGRSYDAVQIWDVARRRRERAVALPRMDAYNVAWLDENHVATGGQNGVLSLIDSSSGEVIRRFEAHDGRIQHLIPLWSRGRLLSTGLDGLLKLWDASFEEPIWAVENRSEDESRPNRVLACAVRPDRRVLATGGDDALIRLWRVEDGSLLRVLESEHSAHGTLAFSPDGRLLLARSARPDRFTLLEVESGTALWSVESAFHPCFPQFLPDGRRIVAGGRDGSLAVWDVDTGERIVSLPGHEDEAVNSLVVSPESVVITGAFDGTLRFWDVREE